MEEKKMQMMNNVIHEGLDTSFICKVAEETPEFVDSIRRAMEES